MLVLKLWYFLFFAAASCLYPYFNLFFRRAGLTEQQVGAIAALRPWVGLPAGSLLSGVADKWRLHRTVLILAFVLSTAARLSVSAVTAFYSILAIMLVGDASGAPVTIITDSAAMAACPKEGEYARQRLFGAIGWGIFSFVAGGFMQQWGSAVAFQLSAVLSLVTLVPTLMLPWGPLHAKLQHPHADEDNTNSPVEKSSSYQLVEEEEEEDFERARNINNKPPLEQQQQQQGVQVHFFRSVGVLLSNPEALIFFIIVTVMGIAVGTIECVLFLYLEDLGGSETLMGLTLTVTCIAETAVFYWTGAIIRTLGLDRCLHLCFAAFLLRLGCYATLAWWGSPWLVLPVELLHGLTFGLTWSAGTAKSAIIAPPGLEATTQGVFQGLMFGMGHGTGGLVAGRMYQQHGPQASFALAFCVVAVGWVATAVAHSGIKERARENNSNNNNSVGGGGTRAPVYMQVPTTSIEMSVQNL